MLTTVAVTMVMEKIESSKESSSLEDINILQLNLHKECSVLGTENDSNDDANDPSRYQASKPLKERENN